MEGLIHVAFGEIVERRFQFWNGRPFLTLERIEIRPVGVLAQSFDHRAVDGAYSAAYLRRVKQILESREWIAVHTQGEPRRRGTFPNHMHENILVTFDGGDAHG